MTLKDALEGKQYIITSIETDDDDMDSFLLTLGCFAGESITVISKKRNSLIVAIKDGRYNIDNQLAAAIALE